VKNIKLIVEERTLCVPVTYILAFFLVAALSLQAASTGEGLTMHGSDDEEEPTADPRTSNFPNFDFNLGGIIRSVVGMNIFSLTR
jgi:hypothetical protein